MSITLRQAGPGDEAFLFELYASTREREVASWGWDEQQKEAFLRLQFAAQQRHYSVAYEGADHHIILIDERPAGRLLVLRTRLEIRLVDIALLPQHQNRGTGTQLIRALQDEAATARKPLRLHVAYFSPAVRLYRRLGFVQIGDTGSDYFMEWTRR